MEMLGAGGTVSELISCYGINYKNVKTLEMLRSLPQEQNFGIQLFGDDPNAMGEAAAFVEQEIGPKFIDINMGCPVRKVVTKGAGSALMKEEEKLGKYFNGIKKRITIPLTVKIRTGWDENNINAEQVVHIAKEEGLSFVSIHGRTRAQGYKGLANWEIIEEIASKKILPILGNGDLHWPHQARERLLNTNCSGLLLARGPLRSPFIFTLPYLESSDDITFDAADYLEIIEVYLGILQHFFKTHRPIETNLKKQAVWMAQGLPGAASFRSEVFHQNGIDQTWKFIKAFYGQLAQNTNGPGANFGIMPPAAQEDFMAGGHG